MPTGTNILTRPTTNDPNLKVLAITEAKLDLEDAKKAEEVSIANSLFFRPAKNLLEEEGVPDLLAKIIKEAQIKAKPISEAINTYLDQQEKSTRMKHAYTILRELKGLMATGFLEPEQGPAYEVVFNTIKHEVDQKYVARIEANHEFAISSKDAIILKTICPQLFLGAVKTTPSESTTVGLAL